MNPTALKLYVQFANDMGLDITVHKNLILRSGRKYDAGAVPCYSATWDDTLWWQKEAYFMADYAYMNLQREHDPEYGVDDDSPYYGDWILTSDAVLDILEKCSRALIYDEHSAKYHIDELNSLFPLGKCGSYHYNNSYNKAFFDDVRLVVRTLPCVLEYVGDTDVELILKIY